MRLFFIMIAMCAAMVGQTDFSVAQEIPDAGIRLISYELGGKFYSSAQNRPEGLNKFEIIFSTPASTGVFCRVEWGEKSLILAPESLGERRYRLKFEGEPIPEAYVFIQCARKGMALIRVTPFAANLQQD